MIRAIPFYVGITIALAAVIVQQIQHRQDRQTLAFRPSDFQMPTTTARLSTP